MRKPILSRKGFTLIELLIVIALLGALAIGLIGALDPFEQLKKGADTGTRNTVSEIQSAVIRYYALKGYMPWCATTCSGAELTDISGIALNNSAMTTVINNIIATGELKSSFTTLQSNQMGKVYVRGTDTNVTACFRPDSKSFRADPNTKYNLDGTPNTGTCDTTDANACYWCVQ